MSASEKLSREECSVLLVAGKELQGIQDSLNSEIPTMSQKRQPPLGAGGRPVISVRDRKELSSKQELCLQGSRLGVGYQTRGNKSELSRWEEGTKSVWL